MQKYQKQQVYSSKMRTTFKYELQDHNEIYYQPQKGYPLELHSTAHTHKHPPHIHQDQDSDSFQHQPQKQHITTHKKHHKQAANNKRNTEHNITPFSEQFDDNYIEKVLCLKSQFYQPKSQNHKSNKDKYSVYEPEDFDIFLYSSESHQPIVQSVKTGRIKNRVIASLEQSEEDRTKELNRQKRGLASISEKVKDIVAVNGKMTFKEVSDELLKNHPLPINPDIRKREMSNIRRRVYDALNVLLTVGILQKEQRHVLPTHLTSIPGKKHSKYWNQINNKKKILGEMKEDYEHKQHIFKLLEEKMQLIGKLHERNRKLELREEVLTRFNFPLVCWIPHKHTGKIYVNIEHVEQDKQRIKKYTIEGQNQAIQTDIDMLKYIDLAEDKKRSFLDEEEVYFKEEQRLIIADQCPH